MSNGEIDFEFDLGASIQIARPFNLDLSSITDSLPGPLAGIVNTLIGAGGSGNLTVNVGANLHIALGLDLSQPASLTAGSLHINATGGTFKVTYNGHSTSALAWNISSATSRPHCSCCRASAPRRWAAAPAPTRSRAARRRSSASTAPLLTGSERSFFLKTGTGDHDTHLDLTASAAGTNLNFNARLGPFGLFIKDGTASLGGTIRLNFLDGPHSGHFNLVGFGDGGVSSDLGSIGDFIGAGSVCVNPHGLGLCDDTFLIAHADLPLFVGTQSFQIPINDPILASPPANSNHLIVNVGLNVTNLLNGTGDVFEFTINDGTVDQMPWANFSPQMPSLFALLADPSVIVDGLDSVLGEVQDLLQGQIFGVKLPLLGDLLQDNPVSNLVGQIRTQLLQPLANLLRENNVGFDGLEGPDPVEALRRLRPGRTSTSSRSSTARTARRRRATSTSRC